jgi:hypothetical protein
MQASLPITLFRSFLSRAVPLSWPAYEIYGPHFWNTDLSLVKSTRLTEKLELQLRVEAFNIFNHPNFALPNGALSFGTDPSTGQPYPMGVISQTPDVAQGNPGLGGEGPRVLQIGARLQF